MRKEKLYYWREFESLESDIVVLPELCNCGYVFEDRERLRAVAESVPDGDFLREFMDLLKLNKCGIIAGKAEIDSGEISILQLLLLIEEITLVNIEK